MAPTSQKLERNDSNNEINIKIRLEIFKNKIRLRIFLILTVYGELSLTELSTHMNKSKPALYRHLQIMIELGVIKVSRQEKVRGSIMAKYYSLEERQTKQLSKEEILATDDPEKRIELVKDISEIYKSAASLFRNSLDLVDPYTAFLEEEVEGAEEKPEKELSLDHLLFDNRLIFHITQLTQEQYLKYLEYYQAFCLKVENMITVDLKSDKLEQRPYYVQTVIMPLKKLLNLESEKNNL